MAQLLRKDTADQIRHPQESSCHQSYLQRLLDPKLLPTPAAGPANQLALNFGRIAKPIWVGPSRDPTCAPLRSTYPKSAHQLIEVAVQPKRGGAY
ncbi:hypothetical protein DSO57_1032695 [Entomophthora muscae]|uniref:Uncharacterized protein n=1 Tax=Entomophthora muscae TaxID=34485 RepID=A0ACC2TY63_9FUNG|nr:hypothetical protein DSO57_1032695 [Entomophthora muscae]